MAATRKRITLSVAPSTIAIMDEVVAAGQAETRSSAADVLAATWQRLRDDADLIAAAESVDGSTEADMEGVIHADRDTSTSAVWSTLSR